MEIIEQIFEKDFLSASLDAKSPFIQWIEVDRAVRSVRIECPDYRGPFPESFITQEAHNKILEYQQKFRRPLVLETPLQMALGGSQYVVSGLMTRHGHHVGRNCVIKLFRSKDNFISLQIT